MVVCRYFQQGTCKFGANCRFEHSTPQYGGNTTSPLLRQSQPPPNVTAPKAQSNPYRAGRKEPATIGDVFNLMQQDLSEAEKGSVWPLSCYNFWPAIARGTVPGLEDLSPEEMRHLQLEAQKSGNMAGCLQQIQQLYQQARATVNGLKVPSTETVSIIETMVRDHAAGPANVTASYVSHDAWPTASASSQNSIFGGHSSSTNPAFRGSQPSAFGAPMPGQQSLFGGSPQPSIFGIASPTSPQKPSVFGGATQPVQSAPSFGSSPSFAAAAAPQMSIFGGATQPAFAGSPQQAPIFGGAGSQPAAPFGAATVVSQNTGSIFGGASAAAPTPPSSFSFALANNFGGSGSGGAVAPASPFGGQSNQPTSIFGGAVNQPPTQPAGSIFGGLTTSQPNPQVSNSTSALGVTLNSTLYTPFDQLTEAERKEFEAQTFTVGCIPTRPPPKEFC